MAALLVRFLSNWSLSSGNSDEGFAVASSIAVTDVLCMLHVEDELGDWLMDEDDDDEEEDIVEETLEVLRGPAGSMCGRK